MARQQALHHISPRQLPRINHVTMEQPWQWLRAGWHDLWRHPAESIGYGVLIAAAVAFIVLVGVNTRWYDVVLYLLSGFVLLAPVAALGFYDMSRRFAAGEPVSLGAALRAWGANPKGTLGMGAIMVLLLVTWFMISIQLIALLSGGLEDVGALLSGGGAESTGAYVAFFVDNTWMALIPGFFLTGLVAVLVAFGFTAVSIPLLQENPGLDTITALVASWKAVTRNWRPMLLWAVIIAVVTAIGMAAGIAGLALTMPLLGHASWFAYRDTLGEWQEIEQPKAEYY